MRFEEFYPEHLDEAMPAWAKKGALALGAAGAIAGGSMLSQKQQAPTTPVNVSLSDSKPISKDVMVLAQTMWGEARGHGRKGMLAVGNVIKNRAEDIKNARLFGQGIIGVALKPKQFSAWNPGDPNLERAEDMKQFDKIIKTKKTPDGTPFEEWFGKFKRSGDYIDYKLWQEAIGLAQQIVSGNAPDITGGATYYHTTEVKPFWAKDLNKIGKIENHVFYRLHDKK